MLLVLMAIYHLQLSEAICKRIPVDGEQESVIALISLPFQSHCGEQDTGFSGLIVYPESLVTPQGWLPTFTQNRVIINCLP